MKYMTHDESLRRDIDEKSSDSGDVQHDRVKIRRAMMLLKGRGEAVNEQFSKKEMIMFQHLLREIYAIKRQIFAKIDYIPYPECSIDYD